MKCWDLWGQYFLKTRNNALHCGFCVLKMRPRVFLFPPDMHFSLERLVNQIVPPVFTAFKDTSIYKEIPAIIKTRSQPHQTIPETFEDRTWLFCQTNLSGCTTFTSSVLMWCSLFLLRDDWALQFCPSLQAQPFTCINVILLIVQLKLW